MSATDDRPDELLTATEMADRLKVKPGTILGWYRNGRIPGRKLSHKILRFNPAEVVAALDTPHEATGRGER